MFQRNVSTPYSGFKRKPREALFSACFELASYSAFSSTLKEEMIYPTELFFEFHRTELFTTTAVRTSDLTNTVLKYLYGCIFNVFCILIK
jgi:hypothetical protein